MTKVRRLFFSLFLFGLSLAAGLAQATPSVITLPQATLSVITEHYTTSEGLPSNNVLCALKDRDGFLWFGTWYGLCRFDGSEFVTFNQIPSNNPSVSKRSSDIPPRKVETIVEDAHGLLWLKTVDWKLYVFNRQTECFHAVYNELKEHTAILQVIKIQRTDDGQVLLLTKDKTLLLAHSDKNGAISITKLFDSKGQIEPQTFQLKHDIVTSSHGFTAYIGRDYRLFLMRQGSQQALANAMKNEESQHLQHVTRLEQMAALAGIDKYTSLYRDRDSLLWVTTTSSGIFCISSPRHSFHLIPLPDNDTTGVRGLYQLHDGRILVGTRSRNVYFYDTNGALLQTLPYNRFGIGAVYHTMEDAKGRLWLSTKGDGLVVIDNPVTVSDALPSTTFRHYRHDAANPRSISGNNVYMTFADSKGHIWVGTLDGGLNLVSEQGDSLTFYHRQHGLNHYPAYGQYTEVRNMAEDKDGRLWVGTIDGLFSLNTQFRQPLEIQFTTYRDHPGATFANNDIYTLYTDQQGQLWVGAFGGGLQRMKPATDKDVPTFEPLGPREGLRNDVVYSVTEDLHGHLWFATEVGLASYNQQTGRIRNFDRYDGLPAVRMEEASALCTTDGHLWMGCREGILTFSPDQLQTSKADYRTFIVRIVADNKPYVGPTALPYTDEIELPHDDNSFTVEFSALNFQNRAQLSYRYRLEGFDRDWRYSGPHRVGSYNEVPPGRYTFIVEAIDDANPTLHSSARLVVRILPPWWQTWWAYCFYIIVAAVIAWIIVRTVLQMNRMRNEVYISQRLAKLTSKPDDGDEFIDNLHRIIRNNISNTEFNIDTIAQEIGMSRSAFYKKVKHQTGFAPVDLIKEFRLSYAAELLQTTTHSITEVAWKSGFRDVSYFGKCFRKRYGLSPREYVNNNS